VYVRCAATTESDFLEVSGSAVGRPSYRYCSTKDKPLPGAVTATNGGRDDPRPSELRLTFQTDAVFDATGFQAVYEYSTFVPSTNSFFSNKVNRVNMIFL